MHPSLNESDNTSLLDLPPLGGAGGIFPGGGGTVRDTLGNKASLKILDLLCEGPIKGLVDGEKSIFLNRTAVRGVDNELNFEGFTSVFRTGTQTQSPIEGFDSIESETGVGTEVRNDTAPVVRTIVNANLNAIRVRLRWEQLLRTDARGRVRSSAVDIRIEIRQGAGVYVTKVDTTVSGISRGAYEKAWVIKVSGAGPWDVRVSRLNADATGNEVNAFTWASYTEIIYEKLRYPNSVIAGLSFQAEQFNSEPTRQYLIDALIVPVPTNATVNPTTGALTYSGNWNGTFKNEWTSNPVWCLYGLLTNDRWGVDIPPSQINKWDFYTIGQYCDTLVSDGRGGTEPRFSCNLEIRDRAAAYEWINKLCSIFRGMALYEQGSVTLSQDAPGQSVRLFNQTNVKNGAFEYSGSSKTARHSVAVVSWTDPNDFYRKVPKVVINEAAIALYGYRELRIDAVGCSSESQAERVGRWALLSEEVETDTVTFTTASQGIPCRPGQIISVGDPFRDETRFSGRIVGGTVNQILLDRSITLPVGVQHTVEISLASGLSESRVISGGGGTATTVLNVTVPFSAPPTPEGIWNAYQTNAKPKQYRVLGVTEADGDEYTITGISHDPTKYNRIETGFTIDTPTPPRRPSDPLPPPRNVTASIYVVDGGTPYLGIGWQVPLWNAKPDPTISFYEIQYRNVGTTIWSPVFTSVTLALDIPDLETGANYAARVRAVSAVGQRSVWALSPSATTGLPPRITSYSPTTTTIGGTVTILGSNFVVGGTTVLFNGTAATSVTVNGSGTEITVVVPTGATSGLVTVRTSAGEASL